MQQTILQFEILLSTLALLFSINSRANAIRYLALASTLRAQVEMGVSAKWYLLYTHLLRLFFPLRAKTFQSGAQRKVPQCADIRWPGVRLTGSTWWSLCRSSRRVSRSRSSINVLRRRPRHDIQSNSGYFARLRRRAGTAWKLYTLSEDVLPRRHQRPHSGPLWRRAFDTCSVSWTNEKLITPRTHGVVRF